MVCWALAYDLAQLEASERVGDFDQWAHGRSVRTRSPVPCPEHSPVVPAIAENLRLDTVGEIRLDYLTSSQLVDLDY